MKNILLLAVVVMTTTYSFASVDCDYTKTPSVLEKVIKSKNMMTIEKRTYNKDNANHVTGKRIEQILKMTKQVTGENKDSVLEAVDLFDDNKIYRYDFTSHVDMPADYYTVIFAYSGDTEVGAIFEGGTTKLVAEMSDGDIKICEKSHSKP